MAMYDLCVDESKNVLGKSKKRKICLKRVNLLSVGLDVVK